MLDNKVTAMIDMVSGTLMYMVKVKNVQQNKTGDAATCNGITTRARRPDSRICPTVALKLRDHVAYLF